jgi:hypothetical protein
MCPWVAVIGLVNTIWNMPTTLIVATGSVKLQLRFLPAETPPNLLPNFVADLISIPLPTTSMLDSTHVCFLVVIILALSDWVTHTLACYFHVSTITISDTIDEAMLTWNRPCSSLQLPIGILCGAVCGCEYLSNSLLLVWINEQICQLCGPNWLPNSMLLNLFWTIGILNSYFCG